MPEGTMTRRLVVFALFLAVAMPVRAQSVDTAGAADASHRVAIPYLARPTADELYFQTVSRTGATVDSGTIPRLIRPGGTN